MDYEIISYILSFVKSNENYFILEWSSRVVYSFARNTEIELQVTFALSRLFLRLIFAYFSEIKCAKIMIHGLLGSAGCQRFWHLRCRLMENFKPSTHRKWFIDKKLRENTYPNAASLARDYKTEFGIGIDPRTFAADIADLRHNLRAPIVFNAEKKGYYYNDSTFAADLLPQEAALGLGVGKTVGLASLAALLGLSPAALLPILPAGVLLTVLHKDILSKAFEKLVPANKKNVRLPLPELGKVSVLPSDSVEFRTSTVEQAVKNALCENRELRVVYADTDGTAGEKGALFLPYQLVYLHGHCFVFGALDGNAERVPYALMETSRIETVAVTERSFPAIRNFHIERVTENGFEFIFSHGCIDTILVWGVCEDDGGGYSLLSRIDIFAKMKKGAA